MKIHDIYDVFTPVVPAILTFIERVDINDKLVNALRTPGKQIVVYGHSGSGKTTLLVNKLDQLYECHLTTRCSDGLSLDQIFLDAFSQLDKFYVNEISNSKKLKVSSKLSAEYALIKSQIESSVSTENQTKCARLIPPQLTVQLLAKFIGEVNGCWVIEDFHKVDKDERKKLSQTMKVFMDMAVDYKYVKIIAIGAVDTARLVVEYDPEMRNRVAEIEVPLMNELEIQSIIHKGKSLLNVSIRTNVVELICKYSNGLASVCHQLCLNLCTENKITETVQGNIQWIEADSLHQALKLYIDEASDTLKNIFDKALKQKKVRRFNNPKLILNALSKLPQDGAIRADIYQKITKFEPKYPSGNLTKFLKDLTCNIGECILRYDQISGKYSFGDPLYRVFALMLFTENYSNIFFTEEYSNNKLYLEYFLYGDLIPGLSDIL